MVYGIESDNVAHIISITVKVGNIGNDFNIVSGTIKYNAGGKMSNKLQISWMFSAARYF